MSAEALGRDQDGRRVYSCHDCHHISMTAVCDSCGSGNTFMGSNTLHPQTRSGSLHLNTGYRELDELIADRRVSVRMREGFDMMREDESREF